MSSNKCPSPEQLDRLQADLLSSEEKSVLKQHVEAHPECTAKLQERAQLLQRLHQRKDYDALVETLWKQHPSQIANAPTSDSPEAQKSHEDQKSQTSKFDWRTLFHRHWMKWSLSFGLFCLVIFSLPSGSHLEFIKPSTPNKKVSRRVPKGQGLLRMLYTRGKAKRSQWFHPGQSLRSGDLVQFVFHLKNPYHVMLLGISEKGKVTALFPEKESQSQYLKAKEHAFPPNGSLELDDNPEKETFFLFLGSKPFTVEQAQKALKRAYDRDNELIHIYEVKGPWKTHSLLLTKEERTP